MDGWMGSIAFLAAEAFDGVDEALVEVRRPAEAGQLRPYILTDTSAAAAANGVIMKESGGVGAGRRGHAGMELSGDHSAQDVVMRILQSVHAVVLIVL